MKLSSEYRIDLTVGDEKVVFILRRPTNKEINDFLSNRYNVSRKGRMKDQSVEARIDFFDLLLIGVENLEDDAGPITPDRKELIPVNWKSSAIFSQFEDVEISEKN